MVSFIKLSKYYNLQNIWFFFLFKQPTHTLMIFSCCDYYSDKRKSQNISLFRDLKASKYRSINIIYALSQFVWGTFSAFKINKEEKSINLLTRYFDYKITKYSNLENTKWGFKNRSYNMTFW